MRALFTAGRAHGVMLNRKKIAVIFYTLLLNAVLLATQSGLLLLVSPTATAQAILDPFFPSWCIQNGGTYECKVGTQVSDWSATCGALWGLVGNTYAVRTFATPEAAASACAESDNAEQVRLGSRPGYTPADYPYRDRLDPTSGCSPPRTENYIAENDRAKIYYNSNCNILQEDTRYTPPAFVGISPFSSYKIASCDAGWQAQGSGSPGYGQGFPHVCINYSRISSKEPGPICTKCGNPISIATGNKFQQETDYTVRGDTRLQISRFYNSISTTAKIALGKNWRFYYDRRITGAGVATQLVSRSSGKDYFFRLNGANWLPDSDIADTLTPLTDVAGVTTSWRYYESASEEVELYSATGVLLSITDRTGRITTLTYSDAATPPAISPGPGYLTQVTDAYGRSLQLAYNSTGKLVTITDPGNGVYQYGYDSLGNLATVTSPDNRVRRYLYNEVAYNAATSRTWLLTGIVDENNIRLSIYKYNADGVAYSTEWVGGIDKFTLGGGNVIDALGTTRSYGFGKINGLNFLQTLTEPCAATGCTGTQSQISAYDANGNRTSFTDARGITTLRTFDLSRNLETSRTEASGTAQARTITTTWHPAYRLPVTITEPVSGGSKVTTNTYDNNGNLSQRQVVTAAGTRTWNWTYDAYGRVLTATDARGNTSTNSYYPNTAVQNASLANSRGMLASVTNAIGHTTTITGYNGHGQPLSMTDANGLLTTLVYDARQRLVSRTLAGSNGNETTTYTYDGPGQLINVTLADASTLAYTYDGAHRLVQIRDGLGNNIVYTLDAMGNRIKEAVGDHNGALVRTKTRVYDALNRLQQDIGGANPAAQITQYRYDNNGNSTGITDPLNRVTTNQYDALNRLMQVVDPFNGAAAPTQYTYDVQDNLTQVADPKNLATVYVYNGFNELTSQTSPDTGTTSFTYDAAGNMLTKTDARGVTATYRYDALNRVNTINYPAVGAAPAETVLYTYDNCGNGKGRLCALRDKTGLTNYSYDMQGRIIAKTQTLNGAFINPTQTVAYRYNAAGQMDTMTLPSGKVVTYAYMNNRPTAVSYDGKPVIKNADYEPFGPIGEWTWGNDTTGSGGTLINKHVRYFDLDGRTTKIESGTTIEPAIIVYDAASRITALQRLTTTNGTAAMDPAKSTSYAYDSLDRLTGVTPNAGNLAASQSFSYDGVGNRLSNTVAGSVTHYTYGTTSHRLAGLTGSITQSFNYDANGNRLSGAASGPNQNWTYGGDNRPTAISVGGGNPVSVQSGLNALGQRVLKTVNSASQSFSSITRFVYDEAGRLIGEYDSSGRAIQETVWLNDLPVAVIK